MPQSLTKLYAHLIFSTKNRKPFLDDEIRPRLHGYLATVVRDLDSPFVLVGGRVAGFTTRPPRPRLSTLLARFQRWIGDQGNQECAWSARIAWV